MSNEREGHEEDNDQSIVDALTTLGWVEEKDEEVDTLPDEDNLKEQIKFFKEENKRLIGEMHEKTEKIQQFRHCEQENSVFIHVHITVKHDFPPKSCCTS